MEAVESGHVEVDIATQTEGVIALDIGMHMVGDFEAPDRNHFTLAVNSAGISAELEMIVIGRESYLKDPLTGVWQANPESPTPFGNVLAFGAFNTDFAPEVAEAFTLVGEEQLDSERVYYLRGAVSGQALSDLLDDPQVEGGEGEVEYWIRVEDFLVRKARIRVELPVDDSIIDSGADTLKMQVVMILSDYGKPVDIQAPEVEGSVWLGADDHSDGPDAATHVTVGEAARGAIDSSIDYDYFKFQAEDGQRYQIDVALGTLTDSFVTLYDSDGYEEAWGDDYKDSLASQILWVAPTAGEYYLAVESADGTTGTYTLTITPVVADTPAPDTVVVPAPFEHAMVNVSESDLLHYFLDLVSVLPNTCQMLDGIEVERSGTKITVSITNRAPADDRSDCEWVSRFMTHSVALGTDFKPDVTYTVRVNGVPGPPILNAGPGERGGVTYALGDDHVALTFVGRSAPVAVEQPVSGTVAVAAYTRDVVGVSVNDSRPPQHFLEMQSAVIGCGEFDRIEVERSGDDIFVSVTNRRPVEGNCTSAGLSYTTHSVSVGTDFEPSVTYTVRVNVRDDSSFTLFSGWLGYDRIGNYATVEVPATIKSLAVSRDVAGRRYLDIVLGLPNTCSEFGGAIVEQTGTEITVSVTNRVVGDSSADCARLSRSTESFSVLLGTNFEPGVTYTVHVNDVTTTFGGRPPFDTYPIPAPIESATVIEAESDPPQYFLEIVSGLPNNRCVSFDQVSIRRSGTDIYIVVLYQAPYSNYVPCLDAPPPPQVHPVALGADFEPGVTYTVRVNDFWTGEGKFPPPGTVSTTFMATTPTTVPKRTCMLQPAQPITMEQERTIDSLPWTQDWPESTEALRRLAMHSPSAFEALIQQFGDSEINGPLLFSYASIALCDEEAAIRLLQMPFLSDGGSMDFFTSTALASLNILAQSDLDGLQRVLSHSELLGGITNEQRMLVVVLALEQEEPAAAAALMALPWVQDAITYTPGSNGDLVHRNFEDYENQSVIQLAYMARHAQESFWLLMDKPWVQDGYTRNEFWLIDDLSNMALQYDATAAQLLRMPFLDTLEQGDSLLHVVRILRNLLDFPHRFGLWRFLSSPGLDGGITSERMATLVLLDLQLRTRAAFTAVETLPWIQDGIDTSELDAVLAVRNVALESDPVFRALLTKPWMQDGLTPDEAQVINLLSAMSSASKSRRVEAEAVRILTMPFLEEIDGLDLAALQALENLIWVGEGNKGYLEHVLNHPSLEGGITDHQRTVVAVLFRAMKEHPEMLDVLLDPEQTLVEERSITLPLAGEVALTVIWPGAVGTDASATRTMDLLEHALRSHEEFMDVPYPKGHTIVFITDIGSHVGLGGGEAIILIYPAHHQSNRVTSHEAAHTYWHRSSTWIHEGAATFLEAISARARTGAPLPEPSDSCSQIDSIAELVRLEYEMKDDFYSCNYTLGEGMFLDLYRSLGDRAFRQGFANLYLQLQDETLRDECAGIDRSACHIKAAFVTGTTPENAAIAEAVITRRYYGASP